LCKNGSNQYLILMNALPGTYAFLLESSINKPIQIGRWREIELHCGYYIYIGSALGPGGVRARVLRHLRLEKANHWHIDYLRQHCHALGAWYRYGPERLEHEWAASLERSGNYRAIKGFGCSDCRCDSHLFYTQIRNDVEPYLKESCQVVYWHKC